MTRQELIEQIANGTPLHNDINNVELLRKICFEATKCYPIKTNHKFYLMGKFLWLHTDSEPNRCIKLSAFIDQPKMVEVKKVIEFLNDFFEKDKTKTHVTITLPESSYKQIRFGAELLKSQLLNFLNEQ